MSEGGLKAQSVEVVTPGMHELCDFPFCDLFWVPENVDQFWICMFSSVTMFWFFFFFFSRCIN